MQYDQSAQTFLGRVLQTALIGLRTASLVMAAVVAPALPGGRPGFSVINVSITIAGTNTVLLARIIID